MFKDAIGILDCGVEGFNILEVLTQRFKHENFVYVGDVKNNPYYNLSSDNVKELIRKNLEILKNENVKLIIVTSDVICDLGKEELEKLNIPVFDIVSILTDYVNDNYEQKNIALFAKEKVIDANLYQKNFKYNRLFNIISDEVEEVIFTKNLKTSQSFFKTKEAFKQLLLKNVDVIVTSSPCLIYLKTEIGEYVKFEEITNFGEIVANKINNEFIKLNQKSRGKVLVYNNIEKKKFQEMTYYTNIKYKYIDLEKKFRKQKNKKAVF